MSGHEIGEDSGATRRAYRSPRRAESARATREAVIEAAGRLFVERGYARTTVAAVAAVAQVSPATVKLVAPTKAALLLQVAYSLARGDAAEEPLGERPQWRDALAAPTAADVVARWVAIASSAYERQAAILEVVWQAASADGEVAVAARQGADSRRSDFGSAIQELERRGALRPGLDSQAALDIAWVVVSPELFRLFARCGWSRDRWEAWVLETLRDQLLSED